MCVKENKRQKQEDAQRGMNVLILFPQNESHMKSMKQS